MKNSSGEDLKRIRVLLINPPQRVDKTGLSMVTFDVPLGILYIASYLEGKGIDVKIFDSMTHQKDLQKSKKGQNRLIGAGYDKIRRAILSSKPDIIGISNQFSSQKSEAIEVARIAKDALPLVKVVVGGPHATAFPEEFLRTDYVDYVIRGEGEIAFYELVTELSKEDNSQKVQTIANLSYLRGKRVISNPIKVIEQLDNLPFPAYHLMNMNNYFSLMKSGFGRVTIENTGKKISMITSRGCPHNCVFCSIRNHMGKQWRAHSPEYIIDHILYLKREYGINHISFEDDNLTFDISRFEKILDEILRRDIKLTWDTPNAVRADKLTLKLLQKMKRTGCISLKIGVESGNQDVLDKIVGKSLDLRCVVEAAKMCQDVGIPLVGFFVIGIPGETKKDILQTLDFAIDLKRRYDMDALVLIATPLAGTRMYEIARRNNYFVYDVSPSYYFRTPMLMIKTEEFDPTWLIKVRKKFNKRLLGLQVLWIFKKPSKIIRYLPHLSNPSRMIHLLNYIKSYFGS